MIKKIANKIKKEVEKKTTVTTLPEQNDEKKQGFLAQFISKPVLALVINIVITLIGFVAWQSLSVRELPKITFPTITVKTEYPGAGPNIVESQITIPLEESFAGIEGLDHTESKSVNGQSTVSLHFVENKDLDAAAAEIRDRMAKAKDSFPQGLRDPVISKASTSETELIRLVAYGEKYNLAEIADQMQRQAKGQIESTPGVASVRVYGGGGGGDSGSFQIHAFVSPEKLHAYDLTIKDMREAIAQNSFKKPLGDITKKEIASSMTLNQAATGLDDYSNMVMKHHKSGLVRLRDVASVEFITDDPDSKVRYNGTPCVMMGVVGQQGANPMEISKNIRKKLKDVKKSIPRNLKIDISYDRSETINQSIKSVYRSIFEAIMFVFLIMLLFLRSWRSTVIPMITIPICIFGGFFIIYAFGFTINTLTLLAIVLAIGLVVDDAIVVLENIYRYIEKGMKPFQAAITGIKEIQFAVIAMTLTLMAVYAPITFAKGLVGKLFIEFAITLAGTVLISGVVALVLTPMLCARLLTIDHEEKNWQKTSRLYLEKIDNTYKKWLDIALKNSKRMLLICIGLATTAFLVARFYLPRYLMPEVDTGTIVLDLESPSGANATYLNTYAQKLEREIKRTKELRNYTVSLQSRGGQNNIYIKLVDNEKRKRSCKAVLDDIVKRTDLVQSGLFVRGYCYSGLLGGGSDEDNTVSFVIQSQKSYEDMEIFANTVKNALFSHKNVVKNSIRFSKVGPEKAMDVKIHQDKAAQFNVRPGDIGDMLSFVMRGQPPADRFEKDGKRYPMRIMVTPEFKQDPHNIKRFHVRATKAGSNDKSPPLVSMHELLSITETTERPLAARYEGMRSYELVFNVKNASATKVYADITRLLDRILPNGYKYSPTRELRKTINEGSNISTIFILALLFIFLIMAAQFESFVDPLMIMLSVPMALAGGILVLAIVPNASLNIFTYIALITLIGLITKHGILIIDFANKLLEGKKLTKNIITDAIKEAANLRLRPILMTTGAMILGALPLALARGSGFEIRSQIGWVIVAGLLVGTLFTIFLIPTIYVMIKTRSINKNQVA